MNTDTHRYLMSEWFGTLEVSLAFICVYLRLLCGVR
jgi:hypothetical protein